MQRWRIGLGSAGIALGMFGVFRLLTQVPITSVLLLGTWMIGAVVIHDGLLSPLIIGVGVLLKRVPARARHWLQVALITAGSVTAIALPLIARRGSQPAVKAILQRNYASDLTIIVGVIAAVSLVLYAVNVARDAANQRRTTHGDPQ
jgi:hypothetical protein